MKNWYIFLIFSYIFLRDLSALGGQVRSSLAAGRSHGQAVFSLGCLPALPEPELRPAREPMARLPETTRVGQGVGQGSAVCGKSSTFRAFLWQHSFVCFAYFVVGMTFRVGSI